MGQRNCQFSGGGGLSGGKLKGNPDKEKARVLPDDYPKTAKAAVERQIVLAENRPATFFYGPLSSEHPPLNKIIGSATSSIGRVFEARDLLGYVSLLQ